MKDSSMLRSDTHTLPPWRLHVQTDVTVFICVCSDRNIAHCLFKILAISVSTPMVLLFSSSWSLARMASWDAGTIVTCQLSPRSDVSTSDRRKRNSFYPFPSLTSRL